MMVDDDEQQDDSATERGTTGGENDDNEQAVEEEDDEDDNDDEEEEEEPTENSANPLAHLDPPPFSVDQRVYCRDVKQSGLLYPAIIRQVRLENNTNQLLHHRQGDPSVLSTTSPSNWKFLVHFLGWNARWDRWTHADALWDATPGGKGELLYQQEQERQAKSQEDSIPSSPMRKRKKGDEGLSPRSSTVTTTTSTTVGRKRQHVGPSTGASPTKTSRSVLSPSYSYAGKRRGIEEFCELPFTLKTILVEEWEKVTRRGWDSPHGYDMSALDILALKQQLRREERSNVKDVSLPPGGARYPARVVHDLPAKVTIRRVLKHFVKTRAATKPDSSQTTASVSESKSSSSSSPPLAPLTADTTRSENPEDRAQQFCQGLIELFERALPTCLLYPQERPQYEQIQKELLTHNNSRDKKRQLVDVYGCEYLLRLLVRLPILFHEDDYRSNKDIGFLLTDLIVLLQKNRQACFKGQYRVPAEEEWLDWERQVYPCQQKQQVDKKDSTKKSHKAADLDRMDTSQSNSNENVERMDTRSM